MSNVVMARRKFSEQVLTLRLLLLFFVALVPFQSARSDTLKGVALVIGNGDYKKLSHLTNPPNDARAVEQLLFGLGFKIHVASDLDLKRLTRDLEDFVDDAQGADVALLYYSGHGIEGGGENFLVPVDSDLSALYDAKEKLVPLSTFVGQLQAIVPITIVLLDACRTNPFPDGAKLKLSPGSAPVSIAKAGLGATRDATPLRGSEGRSDSLGTIIGFAAAPGYAALDGEPGGNSPYAAALLKHFDAMSGEEFGTVMRFVTEEVYLKTNGRQRPWVNDSLRRFLYFGRAPAPPTGDEGDILKERRQLLLTIALIPDAKRRQVETAAADVEVPMDALYGMLRALGAEVPNDPAELERVLHSEAERLKRLLAERKAIDSPDAEIVRLTALADSAEQDGLLNKANELRERAKARVNEVRPSREDEEDKLRERNIEDAAVYARSAETKMLRLEYLDASNDYAVAFEIAEKWDDAFAAWAKLSEADTLLEYFELKNNQAVAGRIMTAIQMAREHSSPTSRARAEVENSNANALQILYPDDPTSLQSAITGYQRALLSFATMSDAAERSDILGNLASAKVTLGVLENSNAQIESGIETYRTALAQAPDDLRNKRRRLLSGLGSALETLGRHSSDERAFLEAAINDKLALDGMTPGPEWAKLQNNLGIVLLQLGDRRSDETYLGQAIDAFELALSYRTRDASPIAWSLTQNNLGYARIVRGAISFSELEIDAGIKNVQVAIEVFNTHRVARYLPYAQDSLCLGLFQKYKFSQGRFRLKTARDACASALLAFEAANLDAEASRTRTRLQTIDDISAQAR
ncbi:caspase family protein [Mesorhizobium sp. M0016]|uniref:caspase family protein n=1 Tax=Mesorhizobium sp. M0016 TaxID=2956843 RepID=UPI00333A6F42